MLTEYWLDAHARFESASGLVLDHIEENKLICALSYQNSRVQYMYGGRSRGGEGVASHFAFFNKQNAVNRVLAFRIKIDIWTQATLWPWGLNSAR